MIDIKDTIAPVDQKVNGNKLFKLATNIGLLAFCSSTITTTWIDNVQAQTRNRPDLNGKLIRDPVSMKIYWIDQGQRRHIVSMSVYRSLFIARDRDFLDTDVVQLGGSITADNRLVRCGEQGHPLFGRIYFLDFGRKRHITSMQAMQRNNFNQSAVTNNDCALLNAVPNGNSIN